MGLAVWSPRETIALVSGLSVTYRPGSGRPVHALERATLAIWAGERVGILGESGSGKSTLAAAFLRLLPSDARYESGSIQFKGRDVLTLSETELRQIRGAEIALIPQDPALTLNPVLPVGMQIAEVLRAHSRLTARRRETRVDELLSEVRFNRPQEIRGAYPHQLSGGQRQRVAIAQAMACRPALVIADEPTSKLDAALQAEILSLMRELSQRNQIAFVLITHDPTVLAATVDRIAVMYAGHIIEEGSAEEVFRRPLHPYTQALVRLAGRYMSAEPSRVRFPAIAGEPPDLNSRSRGCPFAPRCPEKMQVCTDKELQQTTPEAAHNVSCFLYDKRREQ